MDNSTFLFGKQNPTNNQVSSCSSIQEALPFFLKSREKLLRNIQSSNLGGRGKVAGYRRSSWGPQENENSNWFYSIDLHLSSAFCNSALNLKLNYAWPAHEFNCDLRGNPWKLGVVRGTLIELSFITWLQNLFLFEDLKRQTDFSSALFVYCLMLLRFFSRLPPLLAVAFISSEKMYILMDVYWNS